MLKSMDQLKLSNISETAPCLFTILFIPLTSSITDGIGGGLILYVILKLIFRERVQSLTVILGLIFLVFFLSTI
jgi:AGZA family xanthine/uracil permease-like MFS transporter